MPGNLFTNYFLTEGIKDDRRVAHIHLGLDGICRIS